MSTRQVIGVAILVGALAFAGSYFGADSGLDLEGWLPPPPTTLRWSDLHQVTLGSGTGVETVPALEALRRINEQAALELWNQPSSPLKGHLLKILEKTATSAGFHTEDPVSLTKQTNHVTAAYDAIFDTTVLPHTLKAAPDWALCRNELDQCD